MSSTQDPNAAPDPGKALQLYAAQVMMATPNPAARQINPDNGLAPPTDDASLPQTSRELATQGAQGAQAGMDKTMGVVRAEGSKMQGTANRAAKQGLTAATAQETQDLAVAGAQAPTDQAQLGKLDELDRHFAAVNTESERQRKTQNDHYMGAVQDYQGAHIYNWYQNAGTGATILGLISQTLAGGLQGGFGMTGPTPLDKVIDRDLAEQKLNIDLKKDKASTQGNLYHDLQQDFKDNVVAEGAFRAIAYNSFAERLKTQAAALGSGQAKTNKEKTLAVLYQQMADNQAKVSGYIGQMALHGGIAEEQLKETWGGHWGDDTRGKQNQGPAVGLAGDKTGVTAALAKQSPAEFTKVVDVKVAADNVERIGGELKTMLSGTTIDEKTGRAVSNKKLYNTADFIKRIDMKIANLQEMFAKTGGLGAISEHDAKLTQDMIGLRSGLGAVGGNMTAKAWGDFSSNYEQIANRVQDSVDEVRAQANTRLKAYDYAGQ